MSELPEPPIAMLAELTHRCPLSCPYCSNPLELNKRSEEIDTNTWLRVLDEAADLGVLQVHFSGGEPTIRSDLNELITQAEKNGLYSNLITAGVFLNEEMLDRFVKAGLQHVQLSVQGATSKIADHIGGLSGGHSKKIKAAKLVRSFGLPLTVNAVIHRLNIDQIDQIIDFAEEMDAQRLEVANVQYYGWGLVNRKALIPTREQLLATTNAVEIARKRLKGKLVIDYVVPDYYARRPKACMGGWGRNFLNITPAGYVLPCHAAETIKSLTFEKVSDRPLADIWYHSEAFKAFRGTDWMPEPCASCDRKELDWGGCRCQAAAITGRPEATDPACDLSPDHASMVSIAETESNCDENTLTYRSFK